MNDDPKRFPPISIAEDTGHRVWECACIGGLILLIILGLVILFMLPDIVKWIWSLP